MQSIFTHTIGVQNAKQSHAYPIIRLPREFHRLASTAATIYETTHNEALVFLVVPHRKRKNGRTVDLDTDIEKTSLTRRRSGVRIASSPSIVNFFVDYVDCYFSPPQRLTTNHDFCVLLPRLNNSYD